MNRHLDMVHRMTANKKRAIKINTQCKINCSDKISLTHMFKKDRVKAEECLVDSTKHMHHSLHRKRLVSKDTNQRKRIKRLP